MSIDPIKTTNNIKEKYLRYLTTAFSLNNNEILYLFQEEFKKNNFFVKGPFLEASSIFKKGRSVEQLIRDKILSPQFEQLNSSDYFPIDRPLHFHQEKAIIQNITKNKNIVVATGTGSGKTEIFLISILNYLFQQKEEKKLNPGVRALILYPMNALVNDQLKRLRGILKNCPDITFGRYTSQTKPKQKDALENYQNENNCAPLTNEIISREKMQESPPHILITNYAMLEYLLIRPKDHVFFDGLYSNNWKYLVLDEAHTYNGAKGIEIAMLIRRLKQRVMKKNETNLSFIATSATLGNPKTDTDKVVYFAKNLFSDNNFSKNNIIYSEKEPICNSQEAWGRPNPDIYIKLQNIINENTDIKYIITEFKKIAEKYDIAQNIISNVETTKTVHHFLYEVLKGDQNLIDLQLKLEDDSQELNKLFNEEFSDSDYKLNNDQIISLVDLAVKSRLRDCDQPLLPARYHLFVSATQGAYYSLAPERKLFLVPQKIHNYNGKEYIVAELALCRWCGAEYLVGSENEGFFKHPENFDKNINYYILNKQKYSLITDENEFNEDEIGDNLFNLEKYKICVHCGRIDDANIVSFECKCKEAYTIEICKLPSLTTCRVCGKFSPFGLISRFNIGNDAASSVLTNAVINQLNMDKKKLLVFSDSRQDAAFFAPYFNRTYKNILRRNIIIKTIIENKDKIIENEWTITDLASALKCKLNNSEYKNIFNINTSQECEDESKKWLYYELLCFDKMMNLEKLGIMSFTFIKPQQIKYLDVLKESPWNLSEDEIWKMYQILLYTVVVKGVIDLEKYSTDDFFTPRNKQFYIRENKADYNQGLLSWCPSNNKKNTRLDYLIRLTEKMNIQVDYNECRNILSKIWEEITNSRNYIFKWNNNVLNGRAGAYTINNTSWKLISPLIDENILWYRCDKCYDLTLYNLKNTCLNYRCNGILHICNPEEEFKNNHYRNLYFEDIPLISEAKEHTAQLTSENAEELQKEFIEGKVNILSCSTTFELGVDVGELETVLMRNVPPSATNYVQRAGRAGRRTDSTAFSLTFAQNRSHDKNHYNDPFQMINGKIGVPHFEISNEKIVLRHIYAYLLGLFFKENEDYFWKIDKFIKMDERMNIRISQFINDNSQIIKNALKIIVPEKLQKVLDIENFGWTDNFVGENGILTLNEDKYKADIKELNKIKDKFYNNNEMNKCYNISNIIQTLEQKDLLSYLSSNNIIPKYGFPVDIVELQIPFSKKIQLERDLRVAISEYAPSSEVVAGGKLWVSRYIKKTPKMQLKNTEWETFTYAICPICKNYTSIRTVINPSISECSNCKTNFIENKPKMIGKFLIPAFGFIGEESTNKLGDSRPEKTYSTRVYFSGKCDEKSEFNLNIRDLKLKIIPATNGKLGIINNGYGAGFCICSKCGYSTLLKNFKKLHKMKKHKTYWGGSCNWSLTGPYHLGHEFKTDILQIIFDNVEKKVESFWYSLLYALLEGISEDLNVERSDIDGVLYNKSEKPALIVFDDVPGGAGHVLRLSDENIIKSVFKTTLKRLEKCDCGGKSAQASCYGCLKNYRNQFCHNDLNRGKVIEFLKDDLKIKK